MQDAQDKRADLKFNNYPIVLDGGGNFCFSRFFRIFYLTDFKNLNLQFYQGDKTQTHWTRLSSMAVASYAYTGLIKPSEISFWAKLPPYKKSATKDVESISVKLPVDAKDYFKSIRNLPISNSDSPANLLSVTVEEDGVRITLTKLETGVLLNGRLLEFLQKNREHFIQKEHLEAALKAVIDVKNQKPTAPALK